MRCIHLLLQATPYTLCQRSQDMIKTRRVSVRCRYYRSFQAYGEQPAMFPPGNLMFLRPFKGKRPQQTVWDAVWVDGPGEQGHRNGGL